MMKHVYSSSLNSEAGMVDMAKARLQLVNQASHYHMVVNKDRDSTRNNRLTVRNKEPDSQELDLETIKQVKVDIKVKQRNNLVSREVMVQARREDTVLGHRAATPPANPGMVSRVAINHQFSQADPHLQADRVRTPQVGNKAGTTQDSKEGMVRDHKVVIKAHLKQVGTNKEDNKAGMDPNRFQLTATTNTSKSLRVLSTLKRMTGILCRAATCLVDKTSAMYLGLGHQRQNWMLLFQKSCTSIRR